MRQEFPFRQLFFQRIDRALKFQSEVSVAAGGGDTEMNFKNQEIRKIRFPTIS